MQVDENTRRPGKRGALGRYAPLAALATAAVAAYALFGDRLSFEALERNRDALIAWRDANYVAAAAAFVAAYAAAVAVSLPGAIWLTLAGGFLFGTWVGGSLTAVGATAGACAIFLAARSGLGDALRARAGGWLARLEAGFRDNAASYMLALRLTPVAPFFVVNLAPAFLGVPFRTYLWTTFVGILPATFVFASVGAGLGAVFARGERPDLGVVLDWPVLAPLLGLAALSLTPVAVKALRARRDARRGA